MGSLNLVGAEARRGGTLNSSPAHSLPHSPGAGRPVLRSGRISEARARLAAVVAEEGVLARLREVVADRRLDRSLGGNQIGLFRIENWTQYRPQNRPKVPFEKDACINLAFWTSFLT